MAMTEALVDAHQQGLIGAVAAADGGLYGAVGTGDTGHGGEGRRDVAGKGGRDGEVERGSGGQAGNARYRMGNDGAGQWEIASTERTEVGALYQAGFDIERVVEDAAAAANHGAVIRAPGETG